MYPIPSTSSSWQFPCDEWLVGGYTVFPDTPTDPWWWWWCSAGSRRYDSTLLDIWHICQHLSYKWTNQVKVNTTYLMGYICTSSCTLCEYVPTSHGASVAGWPISSSRRWCGAHWNSGRTPATLAGQTAWDAPNLGAGNSQSIDDKTPCFPMKNDWFSSPSVATRGYTGCRK